MKFSSIQMIQIHEVCILIYNFLHIPLSGVVTWENESGNVSLSFPNAFQVKLLKEKSEVLIVADPEQVGNRNLLIFDETGNERLRPYMPSLSESVDGVYSLWHVDGNDNHTAILLCNEYSPYETACTFNEKTGEFTNFHPTK